MQSDIEIRTTPWEHYHAYERVKRTAEHQLCQAQTAAEKRYWQHQIDRADGQLLRWQAQIDKEIPR